jgi:hypothetical protein
MTQLLVQSFMRGEMTVGVVLTLLLISGRNDARTIAYSLGGIAIFLLLQGFIPVSKRGPGRLQAESRRPQPQRPGSESKNADSTSEPIAQPSDDRPTTISPCACSQKPFNRREYFIRAAVSSLVILGTAFLIYWFAPPLG